MENEYGKIKDELAKIKYLIKKTPYNKKKILLISDYVKLCSYLDDLGIVEIDVSLKSLGDDYLWYKKIHGNEIYKYVNDYFDNIDLIDEITNKLKIIYQKYPIIITDKHEDYYVNHSEMMNLIHDFLANLDNEIYRVFKHLSESKHILMKKDFDCDGCAYNISSLRYPYVILDDRHANYSDYSALVHEIGHCYEFSINKTNKPLFDFYGLIEVPAIFLQKLFDSYLIKNNCYKNAAFNETVVWRQQMTLRNFVNSFTNNAYFNNQIIEILTDNDDIIINKQFYENFDKMEKISLEYYQPNIDNYLYVISDVIANCLINVYEQNHKEGLDLFKRFIRNAYYYSYRENILEYLKDFSYEEKEIQKIYEFQKHKYHL